MSATLAEKFRGCLLGAMVGDCAGAVVEGEAPSYIRRYYDGVDSLLQSKPIPGLFGGPREAGFFTDDMQMTICVAEWLIEDDPNDAKALLRRFSQAYETWRGYGAGARVILEKFPHHEADWMSLATAIFPNGSFGNGSAMRVAPVGLCFHQDLRKLIEVARTSSLPTHRHTLAIEGAALQATAVAAATRATSALDRPQFMRLLQLTLEWFRDAGLETETFQKLLDAIESGLGRNSTASEMEPIFGSGVEAHSAVPMAIYCFLANADSFERTISEAIYLGGDTDTIASMAGAISGAYHGEQAIPKRWLEAVKERLRTPDPCGGFGWGTGNGLSRDGLALGLGL